MNRSIIKEINGTLYNYDIGKAVRIKRVKGGLANINYKLVTKQGIYLLKICKEKPINEIEYEVKILIELSKMGFPVALPIKRNDGGYITQSELGNVVIYHFVNGKEPKINNRVIKTVAETLARLNSVDYRKLPKRDYSFNIQFCKNLAKKINRIREKYPELCDFFIKETEYLSHYIEREVPIGLIHGDIFVDNTIFEGKDLKAIIDFEETCIYNLVYDVAVGINGFCFIRNRLDFDKMRVFLKSYFGAHVVSAWCMKELLIIHKESTVKWAKYFMNRSKMLKRLSPCLFSIPGNYF